MGLRPDVVESADITVELMHVWRKQVKAAKRRRFIMEATLLFHEISAIIRGFIVTLAYDVVYKNDFLCVRG